jgi:hypothetical protein
LAISAANSAPARNSLPADAATPVRGYMAPILIVSEAAIAGAALRLRNAPRQKRKKNKIVLFMISLLTLRFIITLQP